MPRPLRYTLIGLLWAAVAGYIVYSAARVRTHRRQLVVQRLDIEIADSSSHGQLVTGGAVRQWLARSGVKTVGAAAREVDLRSIEGLILRNGFVADATASIDYGGVLRIAVRQRRPVVRLLFDGYNAYATDEGYLFAAPQSSALYVPVMTGSYAPPAPASYTGSIADYTAARIAESEGRIAEIEREKYPLYRAERENDENIKALRRMTIKKGLLERRENFERRVKELREKKARLRREYRYTARVLQERIDKISARQAAEREKQKKLRKSYEDFLKLLNFVVLVEKGRFLAIGDRPDRRGERPGRSARDRTGTPHGQPYGDLRQPRRRGGETRETADVLPPRIAEHRMGRVPHDQRQIQRTSGVHKIERLHRSGGRKTVRKANAR